MTLDLESEDFQTLLTDALRAGPGSPQWHQAVRLLRQQSEAAKSSEAKSDAAVKASVAIDEYTLLCTARERLESGKSYRSVRAGPGFTRKVMEQVKGEGEEGGRISSTGVILLLAGLVIIAAIVAVTIVFIRGSHAPENTENLAGIAFTSPAIPEARFDAAPATTEPAIPAGWRQFGDLPLMIRGGLCPNPKPANSVVAAATAPTEANLDRRVGGIVSASPLPADQPLDFNLSFKINSGKDFIAQAFVGDEPMTAQSEGAGSAGPREVVFQLAAGEGSVFLSGRAEPKACRLPVGKPIMVRILADRQNVIVTVDGQQLFSGSQQLDAGKPRYVGVRFLRRLEKPEQNARDNVLLLSVDVQKP